MSDIFTPKEDSYERNLSRDLSAEARDITMPDILLGSLQHLNERCFPTASRHELHYENLSERDKRNRTIANIALTLASLNGVEDLSGNIAIKTPNGARSISRSPRSDRWGETGDNGDAIRLLYDIAYIQHSPLLDKASISDQELWSIINDIPAVSDRHTIQYSYDTPPIYDESQEFSATLRLGETVSQEYSRERVILGRKATLFAIVTKKLDADDFHIIQKDSFRLDKGTGLVTAKTVISPATEYGHLIDDINADDLVTKLAELSQRMTQELPKTNGIMNYLSQNGLDSPDSRA